MNNIYQPRLYVPEIFKLITICSSDWCSEATIDQVARVLWLGFGSGW